MFYVRTNTGKEYPIRFMSGTIVGITSVLYIEVIGSTIKELANVFSEAEETCVIYGVEDGVVKKEYRGYTTLIETIVLADTGNIRIALIVPNDTFGE